MKNLDIQIFQNYCKVCHFWKIWISRFFENENLDIHIFELDLDSQIFDSENLDIQIFQAEKSGHPDFSAQQGGPQQNFILSNSQELWFVRD